jgi:hypothetical protein
MAAAAAALPPPPPPVLGFVDSPRPASPPLLEPQSQAQAQAGGLSDADMANLAVILDATGGAGGRGGGGGGDEDEGPTGPSLLAPPAVQPTTEQFSPPASPGSDSDSGGESGGHSGSAARSGDGGPARGRRAPAPAEEQGAWWEGVVACGDFREPFEVRCRRVKPAEYSLATELPLDLLLPAARELRVKGRVKGPDVDKFVSEARASMRRDVIVMEMEPSPRSRRSGVFARFCAQYGSKERAGLVAIR